MKHAIRHIHFVGVGGSGMSGIAEVLHNLGYVISGSDLADSATLRRLAGMGIRTFVGHAAANVEGADAVVTSTAVKPDNPEVLVARDKRIPVVPRAMMLAELMRLKQGIAIAGTHGKTTTTSLVASLLAEAGLDPTFVIGGRLNSAGANARLGSGDYIVVEADESDASFLNLLPVMAVVTNIDADHMETYGHDFGNLKKAFVDFLHRMPFYGTAILCLESPAVREIAGNLACPVTTYGFAEDAQVRAVDVRAVGGQMHFTVQRRNGVTLPDLPIVLNLAGEHNVLNSLAACAAAHEMGIPDEKVRAALAGFKGAKRRLQKMGEVGDILVYDDYGHHPSEICATLSTVRKIFPKRRLVTVFQPHRFSRTAALYKAFADALSLADRAFILPVYGSDEMPIEGVSSKMIFDAASEDNRAHYELSGNFDDLVRSVCSTARSGDVILTIGAGSVGTLGKKICETLELMSKEEGKE